ncbi:3580_t:CDS:2 [Paraglomus brasilianum]|uniref:3580_t:CDS:1 n=1 Tax=Paraglomus brasilianum TaxID=144538 RepID=A0A9N9A4D2_9GLOM|nr:3580_t:CDS:2 [Paraglomus brasilianum]
MSEQPDNAGIRNTAIAEGLFEHFNYTPISFIDDVINTINELIYQAADALSEFVKDESSELSIPFEDVEQGLHQFETLLEAAVDHNFDLFEVYSLRNLFTVPADIPVVLSHHQGINLDVTKSDEVQLDRELEKIRKNLLAAKAMSIKLRREIAKTDIRIRKCENYKNEFYYLSSLGKEHNVLPLPEALRVLQNHLQTIKNIYSPLETKYPLSSLPTLPPSSSFDSRMEYLSFIAQKQTENIWGKGGGRVRNARI